MATLRKDGRWMARRLAGKLVAYSRLSGEDAEIKADGLLQEYQAIPSTEPDRFTFHEAAKQLWYPRVELLRPLTRKKYEGIYVKWVKPALGDMLPRDIRSGHIQTLLNLISKDFSASLATATKVIVSQILAECVRADIATSNYASFARAPKRVEKRIRVLTIEEAADLLDAVAGSPLSAPVFFAVILGLRRGEIAGLKWTDLDRVRGELRIERQRQAIRPHGVQETPLKTSSSRRTLRLTPVLIEEIDRRGNLDSAYICTYGNEPWLPDTLTEKWKDSAMLPGWRFHDLRHGAAGLLYGMGCNMLEIAAVLGHKHPEMSLLYTGITDDRQAKAIASMDAIFK